MEQIILLFHPGAKLPDDAEAIAGIYRDTLREHKALLILDNARDAAQVRPLLPPAPMPPDDGACSRWPITPRGSSPTASSCGSRVSRTMT